MSETVRMAYMVTLFACFTACCLALIFESVVGASLSLFFAGVAIGIVFRKILEG